MRNNISREHKLFLERKESAELLCSVISELNNEHNKGALLVVEGKKDQLALQSLGLHVNCFWLSKEGFSNFLNMAESSKKVILLLDYDRKGNWCTSKKCQYIRDCLVRRKIRVSKLLYKNSKNFLASSSWVCKMMTSLIKAIALT